MSRVRNNDESYARGEIRETFGGQNDEGSYVCKWYQAVPNQDDDGGSHSSPFKEDSGALSLIRTSSVCNDVVMDLIPAAKVYSPLESSIGVTSSHAWIKSQGPSRESANNVYGYDPRVVWIDPRFVYGQHPKPVGRFRSYVPRTKPKVMIGQPRPHNK